VELENLHMMETIHLKVTPIMRREIHVPKDVVRVTNDGNMHPIDLVAAVCKTNRKVSGQMIENFLNSGKLMRSDFVHENNMRLLPFKGGMKLLLLLEGPDSKTNRDRIARLMHLYIAGDTRLKAALDQNEKNDSQLHSAARASFAAEQAAAGNPETFIEHVEHQLLHTIVGIELSQQGIDCMQQDIATADLEAGGTAAAVDAAAAAAVADAEPSVDAWTGSVGAAQVAYAGPGTRP
jgi:hypothetical protein